jgi:hypothetical protein
VWDFLAFTLAFTTRYIEIKKLVTKLFITVKMVAVEQKSSELNASLGVSPPSPPPRLGGERRFPLQLLPESPLPPHDEIIILF